jgi:hypothetical protein
LSVESCLVHESRDSYPPSTCLRPDDYDKLTIDHVHHNGGEVRRLTPRFGQAKYRALLRDGIPRSGLYALELRCYNCNLGSKKLTYAREKQIEESRMPPAPGKKQLTQTVPEDTFTYFEQVAKDRGCSVPKAIEQIAQEHQTFVMCIREIHQVVVQRANLPMELLVSAALPHLDGEDFDQDDIAPEDPYAVLKTTQLMPPELPPPRPTPKVPLLLRLFGARS